MEIEYNFFNNSIYIDFKNKNNKKEKYEPIIFNALPYLQKEVKIPTVKIQDDKIIIRD